MLPNPIAIHGLASHAVVELCWGGQEGNFFKFVFKLWHFFLCTLIIYT